MGGKQKYCPTCAPDAVAEIDRKQGLDYYKANADKINPVRNIKRRRGPRTCVVCGNTYDAPTARTTCGKECSRELRRQAMRRADAKRSPRAKRDDMPSGMNMSAADNKPPKIDWDKQSHLFGTMPDKKLADLLGCAENTVWKRRRAAGITPFGGEKKAVEWDKFSYLVNKVPTTELAKFLGCSIAAVSMYKKSKAKEDHPLKKYFNLLGKMPDNEIAKECGCSAAAVYLLRKTLGIASFMSTTSKSANKSKKHSRLVDWSKYDGLLGTMPDDALAQIIGCWRETVQNRRKLLHIKSFRKHNCVDWGKSAALLGTRPDQEVADMLGITQVAVRHMREKLGIEICKRNGRNANTDNCSGD